MEYYWYVAVCILGAIIGSFLNVIIYRLHTGRSANGRSHCLSCGKILYWYELIPIFSYVALRARCRSCASHIPLRYMFVEVLTAGLFVLLWDIYQYDLLLFALNAIFMSLLIIVFVYDIRHMIIPDELVIWLTTMSVVLVGYVVLFGEQPSSYIYEHILAGILATGFFASFWFFSQGRWMGLGDAKLAFPLCMMLGLSGGFSAVVLSFWIGAVVSVTLMVLQYVLRAGKTHLPFLHSALRMKSEVPFAPFLVLGFLSVYLFHVDILAYINFVSF